MSIPTRSAIFLAMASLVILGIRLVEDESRYTFGAPHLMDVIVTTMLAILAVTHTMIAIIIWVQRRQWLPSDASMFRFIAIKALFWVNAATIYMQVGRGARLDLIAFYILLIVTAVDLDVRIIRRYVLGVASEQEDARGIAWNGEERRSRFPGRRKEDFERNMG